MIILYFIIFITKSATYLLALLPYTKSRHLIDYTIVM